MDQNIMSCIPIFKSENLSFYRKDAFGKVIVCARKHQELQQLELNNVCCDIMNKSTGENTIGDIISSVVSEYKNADEKQVEADVINSLINMWRIGIINWNNITPYDFRFCKKEGNIEFRMLDEDRAIQKLHNIQGLPIIYDAMYKPELIYSEMAVRQRCFINYEIFFTLTIDDENQVFLSLVNCEIINCVEIGVLYLKSQIDANLFQQFLKWSNQMMRSFLHMKKPAEVCKINMEAEEHKDQQELLHNLGFRVKGVLKNELGNGKDIKVYYNLL